MELLIDLKSLKSTKVFITTNCAIVNSTKYLRVKVYFIRLQLGKQLLLRKL